MYLPILFCSIKVFFFFFPWSNSDACGWPILGGLEIRINNRGHPHWTNDPKKRLEVRLLYTGPTGLFRVRTLGWACCNDPTKEVGHRPAWNSFQQKLSHIFHSLWRASIQAMLALFVDPHVGSTLCPWAMLHCPASILYHHQHLLLA